MTVSLAMGVVAGGLGALPWADGLVRVGIDLLLPLRQVVHGPLWPGGQSNVVAIAIDEETYRTPPFADRPQVTWTTYLGAVIQAVAQAQPKAIGLDLIYPTTLDQADLLPGFDKPLRKAFIIANRQNLLVLGKTRLSQQEILPSPWQVAVVGGVDNIRGVNVIVDKDQVSRQYPVVNPDEAGGSAPSFGMELVKRSGGTPPAADFLINWNTGTEDIPEFSMADLYACTQAGKADFFAEHFKDKIVVIGEDLDVGDRFLAAKRFAVEPHDRRQQARCAIPFDPAKFGELAFDRRTIPGMFVHAAAINTVLKNVPLTVMPHPLAGLTIAVLTALLALLLFTVGPAVGAGIAVGGVAVETGLGLAAFMAGIVPPLLPALIAGAVAYAVVYAYRFLVEDRAKRWITSMFGRYVSPEVVSRLAADPSAIALGGTTRTVTVFFSDIAGFTTISERLADRPQLLVEILNRYLTVMTTTVEKHGGYVDKFIGDAVMAFWNAPLEDPEAERHAVLAAIDCFEALAIFNRDVMAAEYQLPALGTRIGINTGIAVVGNMGSETRVNYTVVGDTVNLAARLEGANKEYGTRIMIGESTAAKLSEEISLRRLDLLVVKGKALPVTVYDVVGRRETVTPERRAVVTAYESGLDLYFSRRFAAAAEVFMALDDSAAAIYHERCHYLMEHPPAENWDGRFEMKTK